MTEAHQTVRLGIDRIDVPESGGGGTRGDSGFSLTCKPEAHRNESDRTMPNRASRALMACLLAMSISTCFAQDPAPARFIRVNGQGTVSAVPDLATINTGVVTQAPAASDALQQNSAAMESVLSELGKMGIADRDVQTSQFNVQPQYDRGPRGEQRPEIVGYQVSNQVRVRVRELGRLGAFLDTLVRTGSNQISGISLEVDEPEAVLNEARQKAIENARARAELYAAAAGVGVGKVLSIDENQASAPRPVYFGAAEARGAAVPMAAGEQDFTVTVQVTFELVDVEN